MSGDNNKQLPLPPLPDFSLGTSNLFHPGNSSISLINSNASAAEPQVDLQDDITQFISSSGRTITLKQKGQSDSNDVDGSKVTPHFADINWTDDDSYGININYLMDRIVANEPSTKSIPTNNILNKQNKVTKKPKSRSQLQKEKLWVEKWRPKSFLDLVGNERTNRRILGWLRQWSFAVFKEDIGPSPFKMQMMNRIQNNKNHSKQQQYEEEEEDIYQRPRRKILLIHGPPGIGKTSVAHVVAKQAGYSISEINASDERAGPMVKHKIHNTLFNHTFNDKPVCLIADEVDGSIENGFVKILLDILHNDIKATKKVKFAKENGLTKNTIKKKHGGKKNSNQKTSKVLLRPIIAICNNLYAPALEKLRPFCEIVSFKRPSDNALQERLVDICKKEHMDVNIKTLNNLIDLAQGDVRNCINNLQFMTTSLERLSRSDNTTDNNVWESNQKDISLLWFRVVNQIFQRDPYKDLRTQFYELLSNIEQNGNYDRIVQGCFQAYLHVKYTDNGVTKPAAIADWLYFHDLMNKSIYEQNGELIKYSSIVPLAFYTKFSDIANNKEEIRVKSVEYEMRELKKQNESIVKVFVDKVISHAPNLIETASHQNLIFEILPFLNDIISTDLIKIKDLPTKNRIINVISDLLRQYQLSLLPIENDYPNLHQTNTVLGVNPPFNKLVVFDENRNKEVYIKRPQSLQLLLAKSEEMKVKKRHLNQVRREKEDLEENKLKNKKAKINGSNTVDFFKNQYDNMNSQMEVNDQNITNTTKSNETSTTLDHEHTRIWVKYKAGFSNAVKKNVTWESLWEQ